MTIIAYNPLKNEIVSDRLHSWNDGLTMLAGKIETFRGHKFAYAGGTGGQACLCLAINMILDHKYHDEVGDKTSQKFDGIEGMIRGPETPAGLPGRVYYVHCGEGMLTIERLPQDVFIAIGSGASFMRAFMAEHVDFDKAMSLTTQLVPTCNGPTDTF